MELKRFARKVMEEFANRTIFEADCLAEQRGYSTRIIRVDAVPILVRNNDKKERVNFMVSSPRSFKLPQLLAYDDHIKYQGKILAYIDQHEREVRIVKAYTDDQLRVRTHIHQLQNTHQLQGSGSVVG